jgi:RsiW-degrading membrane proteinase PrsW (M82 family)
LNRTNVLYLIVGALVIVVAVLGYQLYQDRHPPEGLHINVGPGGLTIQGK